MEGCAVWNGLNSRTVTRIATSAVLAQCLIPGRRRAPRSEVFDGLSGQNYFMGIKLFPYGKKDLLCHISRFNIPKYLEKHDTLRSCKKRDTFTPSDEN
jgi:hypothetical protein